jgi:hypothetical protein
VSGRYPRIRARAEYSGAWVNDGFRLDFYMRRLHGQMTREVMRSLDIYLEALGAETFGYYVDDEGDWQELDGAGWALNRRTLLEDPWPRIILGDARTGEPERFRFEYLGRRLDDPGVMGSDKAACVASFWLTTTYLEEQGPERVRELALALAEPLPWCSGNGGLAILAPVQIAGVSEEVHARCFRYPGMDIPDAMDYSRNIGTRVRGPSWLTFLGQPVLEGLGGVEALRVRLHSPGTTVRELEGGRAVVRLGEWPEVGDTEQGHTLPAYRELARVLEPWLYEGNGLGIFPPEDMRRWERRFLD